MNIDKTTLKHLAIAAQGLADNWNLPSGKEGVAQTIERLGHLQIDTISVVERAHHHILWTRCPDYSHDMLHELQAEDRRVFEYWYRGIACYLPMIDFRFHRERFRNLAKKEYGDTTKHVVKRIRKEGALASADFKDHSGRKRGPWWDWKPAKRSLEQLFNAGHLMVSARRSFQRVYDLPERVLPDGLNTSKPTKLEAAKTSIHRSICDQGFAPAPNWEGTPSGRKALNEMADAGEIVRFVYSDTEHIAPADLWNDLSTMDHHVHILSPFDGLLRNRRRLQWLFDFECKLEAYTPEPKRRWGYFCLPILWGDRFVGRFDPKAERKERVLVIKKLMFEKGFKEFDEFLPLFAKKLKAFATFNGCDEIKIQNCSPRNVLKDVRKALR